jgi:hypothetical protein
MRTALDTFHANKQIFIDLGGRKENINIPKVHSLDHYELLIRLFGSADGFNTESPERLHIDYAKNAYRASNRKDYINQMTLWLERQEGVARFSAYLVWAHPPAPPAPPPPPNPGPATSIPITTEPPTEILTACHAYSMAKVPPPATRAVTATDIISPDGHNASRFLPALSTFFRTTFSSAFVPRTFDVFGTWSRISFKLPKIPEVGANHSSNIVRATAPVLGSVARRVVAEPAHLDFALIRTGEANSWTAGTTLEGNVPVNHIVTMY